MPAWPVTLLRRTRPAGLLLGALAACVMSASAASAAGAKCPLGTGTPSGGDVQWAFSETGPPNGSHPDISSAYTHGRGTWTAGRAIGELCSQDVLSAGRSRNLVVAVSGSAALTPHVTEFGLLGVRLVLRVRVSASDDPSCRSGARGTVTLFASYYSTHQDSLTIHFARSCADHDHTFSGPRLHVLISRNGAQVNTASG